MKQEADELTGNTSKSSSGNRRKRNKSSLPAELRKELGDIDLDEDGTQDQLPIVQRCIFQNICV